MCGRTIICIPSTNARTTCSANGIRIWSIPKAIYTRFVVRQIILDALLNWMNETRRTNKSLAEEEILFDASAVLCGTMLMASSISGSGPGVHDSSITLTSLLPRVAHQRDAFYARLLEEAKGARAKRLLKEARQTQQPFGHVRQRLNIELAKYGAKQMQTRHLAQMFARMGYPGSQPPASERDSLRRGPLRVRNRMADHRCPPRSRARRLGHRRYADSRN